MNRRFHAGEETQTANIVYSVTDAPPNTAPWLQEALDRLARNARPLDAIIETVQTNLRIAETRGVAHVHFVQRTPDGQPRVSQLVDRLAEHVVDFCMPRSRLLEAQDDWLRTNSPSKLIALDREARGLFTALVNSGEGGELLLWLLLEVFLGLPQVLCKMPLKTSSSMHVHGVDGVHAEVLDDGTLALYWGESKLYGTVNGAIDDCFKSISPYLLDDGTGSAARDLMLLRSNVDLGDPAVTESLRRYFLADTAEAARVQIRGACLIGFTHRDYPAAFTDSAPISETLRASINAWVRRAGQQIQRRQIEAIHLEVFCFPMPDLDDFRRRLRLALGLAS